MIGHYSKENWRTRPKWYTGNTSYRNKKKTFASRLSWRKNEQFSFNLHVQIWKELINQMSRNKLLNITLLNITLSTLSLQLIVSWLLVISSNCWSIANEKKALIVCYFKRVNKIEIVVLFHHSAYLRVGTDENLIFN